MELRHPRYFIAVAEALHFGRAAAKLGISQPGLSKQIRELEAEVGTPLLWRTKREVRLTAAGQSFLKHARGILSQVARSVSEAQSVGAGDLGSLEIGYLSSASPRIVPRIVRAFKERYPKVDVKLRLLLPPHHLSELESSQFDFLIAGLPLESGDFTTEKLLEEPLILAIPEGHPLARRPRISFKTLDGVPLVLPPRHIAPQYYDQIHAHFERAGARQNVALETFPMNGLICAVAAGVGIAFVPDCSRDNPQKGVVYRRLSPPHPLLEWGIVYFKRDLEGARGAFLNVVREIYRI